MKNEIYNVGSEALNKTKEDIAKMIKEKVKFELYFADKGVPDPDQRDYEVSYKKLRDKGFETSITFQQGINELVLGLQTVTIANPFTNI
jgi:nucleoside-diphosphate-sugar epimerase